VCLGVFLSFYNWLRTVKFAIRRVYNYHIVSKLILTLYCMTAIVSESLWSLCYWGKGIHTKNITTIACICISCSCVGAGSKYYIASEHIYLYNILRVHRALCLALISISSRIACTVFSFHPKRKIQVKTGAITHPSLTLITTLLLGGTIKKFKA